MCQTMQKLSKYRVFLCFLASFACYTFAAYITDVCVLFAYQNIRSFDIIIMGSLIVSRHVSFLSIVDKKRTS